MTTPSAVSLVCRALPIFFAQPVVASSPGPNANRERDHSRLLFGIMMAFLAIGVIARLTRYWLQGAMWGDECAVGLNIVDRDFEGLTHVLDHMQTAPILFLWSERIVYLSLGSSELALRLLPFLAAMAALFVFWDFARRAVNPLAAVLAVGCLAVARWPVYMGATLKPYSFDLLAAAVLVNLAHHWRSRPERLGPLLALVLVLPFALAGSYPAVFVAGAVSLYLLPTAWRYSDRRTKALFVAFNVLMLGTFAANYTLHIQQQLEEQGRFLEVYMREYWADGFPPANPIAFVKWAAAINTGRLFAYPVGDANGGSTLTLVVFLVGIGATWAAGKRGLLVLCLTPFVLNFIAAAWGKYPYGGCCRLSQHLAPAICLLTGVGAAAIIESVSRTARTWLRLVAGWAVALLGIGIASIAFDVVSPDRDAVCKWSRQIKRELERHLHPGDRVVVTTPRFMMDMTMDWQLTRLGDRLAWGVPEDNAVNAPRIWLLTSIPAYSEHAFERDALAKLAPGRVEVGRILYSIPPDRDLPWNWHCQLICLSKPEHAAEKPVFRSSP